VSRVLIVDDDPGTVRGMRTLLEMDGFDTFATTSSADALEALGRERFDIVITDLEMPRVHGVEIVRAAVQADRSTRVFIVSAFTNSAVCDQALAAGATRAFAKPLDYDALVALLYEPG